MSAAAAVTWPVKTRDMLTHHIDSTAWDNFAFRDGDIIIATYAKSGTTWMQQIVSQIIFQGAEGLNVHQMSPWIDFRLLLPEVRDRVDAQTHRRFVKTHLSVDALVFSPQAKYLYIGRDGRDTAWSYHHHHLHSKDEILAWLNSGLPDGFRKLEPAPADPREFYKTWIERDGYPFWSYWDNIRSWWAVRDLPNVHLVHFNEMKNDLEGTIRKVASFLDADIDETAMPEIIAHCGFDYMKAHAETVAPRGGAAWEGGASTFINKGTNGRWRDSLSASEIAAYEIRAVQELGPECARWLAGG
jgi:aryl sulfotransferase